MLAHKRQTFIPADQQTRKALSPSQASTNNTFGSTGVQSAEPRKEQDFELTEQNPYQPSSSPQGTQTEAPSFKDAIPGVQESPSARSKPSGTDIPVNTTLSKNTESFTEAEHQNNLLSSSPTATNNEAGTFGYHTPEMSDQKPLTLSHDSRETPSMTNNSRPIERGEEGSFELSERNPYQPSHSSSISTEETSSLQNVPSGSRDDPGERMNPSTSSLQQIAENRKEAPFVGGEQNPPVSSGSSSEVPPFKDATPGGQEQTPSPYVQTIEQSIEQNRDYHKVAAQGREIRQLKESIEMANIKSSEEEPLEMESTPKMES
jgi:hypothetical protein